MFTTNIKATKYRNTSVEYFHSPVHWTDSFASIHLWNYFSQYYTLLHSNRIINLEIKCFKSLLYIFFSTALSIKGYSQQKIYPNICESQNQSDIQSHRETDCKYSHNFHSQTIRNSHPNRKLVIFQTLWVIGVWIPITVSSVKSNLISDFNAIGKKAYKEFLYWIKYRVNVFYGEISKDLQIGLYFLFYPQNIPQIYQTLNTTANTCRHYSYQ